MDSMGSVGATEIYGHTGSGDDRSQESNQGCLGDNPQVQAGADIEKLHAQTSSPAVRRSDNSDDMPRIWNMGTHQKTRKNDTTDATQKCSDSSYKQKEDTKKIVKHKVKTNEEFDNNDSSCTGDESEDGKGSVSHNDQDSDVSFESDNDEEIDVG